MKPRLVDLLRCPECEGRLELSPNPQADATGEILNGSLDCSACGRSFPIRDGVPRLLPRNLTSAAARTSTAFGWQWNEFTEMHAEYREQFLDWIAPIRPEFFKDKVVMDAGCGMGRHAYYAALYGARDVVAVDLSDAVDAAYKNLSSLPNVHVVQADIYHLPFERRENARFDFIYSIGVLHHLPDPEGGFRALVELLRRGGSIFAWVYGRENNAVVHRFIEPFRRAVSTRLPPRVLPVIAWPLAVSMQAALKGVYRPLHGTRLFAALPSRDYLYSISGFNFRRNYNIVFDQLVAPLASYVSREEFEGWFRAAALERVELSWRNRNSWRGFGQVPKSTPAPAAHERAGDSRRRILRPQNSAR